MLALLVGILMGMSLGMGIMLLISWITCLRHEHITVREHLKDLFHTLTTAPEYRDQ